MMQGGRLAVMIWSALSMLVVVHMFSGKMTNQLFVGASAEQYRLNEDLAFVRGETETVRNELSEVNAQIAELQNKKSEMEKKLKYFEMEMEMEKLQLLEENYELKMALQELEEENRELTGQNKRLQSLEDPVDVKSLEDEEDIASCEENVKIAPSYFEEVVEQVFAVWNVLIGVCMLPTIYFLRLLFMCLV